MSIDNEKISLLRPDFREETLNLFKKINLTDQQIATATHTFYTTVGRWRRGEVSPSRKHFEKLKQLTLSPHLLQEESAPYFAGAPAPAVSFDAVAIPILSNVPTGEQISEDEKMGQILLPPILLGGAWKDCYLLRVHDDSMIPDANNGDWVIIRPKKIPKPEDWIVVRQESDYIIEKFKNQKAYDGVVIWIFKKN